MAKKDHRMKRPTWGDVLGVALIAGGGSFILAMVLDALPLSSFTKSDEWVAITIAGLSAIISGFAVYLVNETLLETRKMVKDQAQIGEDQNRAWLSYDDAFVKEHGAAEIEIVPFIRNYGATPAKNVELLAQAIVVMLPEFVLEEDESPVEIDDLPPSKEISTTTGTFTLATGAIALVKLEWKYETNTGNPDNGSTFLILKEIDQKPAAVPITKSDFYLLDERFEVFSKKMLREILEEKGIKTTKQFSG